MIRSIVECFAVLNGGSSSQYLGGTVPWRAR